VSSSDLALVECVQQGDTGAFDYLVLRHRHDLLRFVHRHVTDPAQAEAVVQDTFAKAYRALSGFPHKLPFFTWLSRIAVDSAGVRPALRRASSGADGCGASDPAPVLTDEIRDTVRSTIERLPREFRSALLMRELQGMTYDQIATAMKCPPRTVRSYIFLARAAIAAQLTELLP
jgi:RNA polymerase sigma-70 factor, ECF subfamily